MYSPKVIERNIEKFEAKSGVKLVWYSIEKVRAWVEHLDSRQNRAQKSRKPLSLTKEEQAFILNERTMAIFDYRYHAERYHFILLDSGGLGLFSFWASQEIVLRHIAELEEALYDAKERGDPVDGILIALHKARQLGACLAPETRVLTADLRWIPIEDAIVGQQLVAVDEELPGPKKATRKLRVATVEAMNKVYESAFRVRMDNGTEFVATGLHRFLCRARGGTGARWRTVNDMRVRDHIRFVTRPWGASSYEDGWFGGILDGEGSVRAKDAGGAEGCMSQVAGKVLDRAEDYLKNLGYTFRDEVDRRKSADSSKLGNKPVHKLVVDRLDELFRLVGQTRPSRFLSGQWWHGKALPGRRTRGGIAWPSIVSIELVAPQMMIDLQTTTGTFIAEGLVSHNSMLAQSIIIHRATTIPHNRSLVASVDSEKVTVLFKRSERIYNNLPWWFVPKITENVKSSHMVFGDLDSHILLQDSKQMSGLAQGDQFETSHLTECSSWMNPEVDIERHFFPTIPQSTRAFSILESTAQVRGDWWHNFCNRLQQGYTRRWRFVFVPWYVEKTKYRAAVPADWSPSKVALLHAQMVYDTSPQFCFGTHVTLPKQQLYWWESTRAEHQHAGTLNIFLTNYCATPEESFQHSGVSPFSTELLEKLRASTSVPRAYELIESA